MYFTGKTKILKVVQIWLLHVVTTVSQQLIVCRHACYVLAESALSGLAEIVFYKLPNIFGCTL